MRNGFCKYSGVWMKVVPALGMIERYILAFKDGKEQSKKFYTLTPRKSLTNVHLPLTMDPAFYDVKHIPASNKLFSAKGRS
jgi:hypothetical protein